MPNADAKIKASNMLTRRKNRYGACFPHTGTSQKSRAVQEALAEMLGISRQALGKWESGASMPTLENLAQLAKIFHLSIDELITRAEHTQRRRTQPCPQRAKHRYAASAHRAGAAETHACSADRRRWNNRRSADLFRCVFCNPGAFARVAVRYADRTHRRAGLPPYRYGCSLSADS